MMSTHDTPSLGAPGRRKIVGRDPFGGTAHGADTVQPLNTTPQTRARPLWLRRKVRALRSLPVAAHGHTEAKDDRLARHEEVAPLQDENFPNAQKPRMHAQPRPKCSRPMRINIMQIQDATSGEDAGACGGGSHRAHTQVEHQVRNTQPSPRIRLGED